MSLQGMTTDLEEVARIAPDHIRTSVYRERLASEQRENAEDRRAELMACVAGLFQFILEDDNARMGLDAYVQEQVRHVAHDELHDAVLEIVHDNVSFGSPQSHQHEVEIDFDLGVLGELRESITSSPADE